MSARRMDKGMVGLSKSRLERMHQVLSGYVEPISSQVDDTVPALRSITLRDLLTYRMGFGSVMAMPDTYPIQKLQLRQ